MLTKKIFEVNLEVAIRLSVWRSVVTESKDVSMWIMQKQTLNPLVFIAVRELILV